MEESTGFVIFIGFIINLWVMYEIIKSATRSSDIKSELKMQTDLLAKMAQKAGVPDDDIKSILTPSFNKKS